MTWEDYKAQGILGRLEAALKGENPTVVIFDLAKHDGMRIELAVRLKKLVEEYA